jgi:hypothetical protein
VLFEASHFVMHHDSPTTPSPASTELDLLMPLYFFLGDGGALDVTLMAGEQIPEPYRTLLVHDTDMTPTLARFHAAEIGLRVLQQVESEDCVMRAVVLDREVGQRAREAVEYGAIGIQLESFAEPVRRRIRSGQRPLGSILEEEGIAHGSHPRGYFQIRIGENLGDLLQAPVGARLFGRCNVLSDAQGIAFADIVEILPSIG